MGIVRGRERTFRREVWMVLSIWTFTRRVLDLPRRESSLQVELVRQNIIEIQIMVLSYEKIIAIVLLQSLFAVFARAVAVSWLASSGSYGLKRRSACVLRSCVSKFL